jgi:hypothetical protein
MVINGNKNYSILDDKSIGIYYNITDKMSRYSIEYSCYHYSIIERNITIINIKVTITLSIEY